MLSNTHVVCLEYVFQENIGCEVPSRTLVWRLAGARPEFGSCQTRTWQLPNSDAKPEFGSYQTWHYISNDQSCQTRVSQAPKVPNPSLAAAKTRVWQLSNPSLAAAKTRVWQLPNPSLAAAKPDIGNGQSCQTRVSQAPKVPNPGLAALCSIPVA